MNMPDPFKPNPDAAVLIDNKEDKVVMDLGLISLIMTPDEADEMGSALIWHAAAIRAGGVDL
jgi:hypothetical protein